MNLITTLNSKLFFTKVIWLELRPKVRRAGENDPTLENLWTQKNHHALRNRVQLLWVPEFKTKIQTQLACNHSQNKTTKSRFP